MSNLYDFDTFKEIWEQEPVVILDTNTLLDLFRYSVDSSMNIVDILEEIKDKIWLPNQVVVEFDRNKETVKTEEYNKYKNVPKDVKSIVESMRSKFLSRFKRYKKYQFPNIEDLEDNFNTKLDDLSKKADDFLSEISEEDIKNKDLLKNNTIERFVDSIKALGSVGSEYNYVEMLQLYQEGEMRYKYSIPPGYMDAKEKDDLRKFGDLIVWKQTLDYARTIDKNIIFVTSDAKEDWWLLENDGTEKKIVAQRNELTKEFEATVSGKSNLNMFTFKEIISHLSRLFNIQSINTMLEINAVDYVQGFADDLYDKIESDIQKHIYRIDMYEVSNIAGRDIDDIDIIDNRDFDITDVYLKYSEDKVTYNVDFTLEVEFNAYARFGDTKDSIGILNLRFEGSFSFDRAIDYDIEDAEDLGTGHTNYTVDYLNIIDGDFIDNEDICVFCGKKEGVYNFNDEGLICEECYNRRSGELEVCTKCGTVFPWGSLTGDVYCRDCSYND